MNHDVLIVGAGVAGSVVARRLAQSGLDVALIGNDSRPGWEGLSIRAVERLQAEGVGLHLAPALRRGRWGVRDVQGQEHLIERSQLALQLRMLARGAGAVLNTGLARGTRRAPEGWRVMLEDGRELLAPWLIDARGRRGAALSGPRLLAVTQRFSLPEQGEAATHIEALHAGWCWWAKHGTQLTLQVTARPRDGHPGLWARRAAAQLPPLAALLRDAVASGPFYARPAHVRYGTPISDDTLWRVGDAAVAFDPLSGQGVYEALRSAQLVATAFTAVHAGSDLALAQQFVRDRQQASFQYALSVAASFYREIDAHSSFWEETASSYEALAARLTFNASGPPRIEQRPVLLDGRIVAREVLITAEHPRGVWQISGVPIASLIQTRDTLVSASLESTAERLGQPLKAVRAAILWLQQSGVTTSPRPQLS